MKYSILFLHWDPENKLSDMTKDSLYSIIQNSHGHDYEILILDRPGVLLEINRGFRQARGEYLIIFSNDVIIKNRWLDYIAVPDTITSWHASQNEFGHDELDCSCVCIPRTVQEKVGLWDENFAGSYGYDDCDYLYRARQLGIPLKEVPVQLTHQGGTTFATYGGRTKEGVEWNRNYFIQKHNL